MKSIAVSAIEFGANLVVGGIIDVRQLWTDIKTRSRMRKRLKYLVESGHMRQIDRFNFELTKSVENPARCNKCRRMRYISSNGINCAWCRDGIQPLALNGIDKRQMVSLGAIQID